MMSEYSAHLTSLPFGFRTWTRVVLLTNIWNRLKLLTVMTIVVQFEKIV